VTIAIWIAGYLVLSVVVAVLIGKTLGALGKEPWTSGSSAACSGSGQPPTLRPSGQPGSQQDPS
jgi:hypothetical protein